MLGVTVLFILQSIPIGIVQSLTQIPKSAFGQLRRIPQEPELPPVQTVIAPEQDVGVDASQYKALIENQLKNHELLQKMILASEKPAAPAAPAAPGVVPGFAIGPAGNRRGSPSDRMLAAPKGIRRTDQAYIESRGPNDFLVLMHKMKDPFEAYIPNDIYYAPRPCVNWFDGCNEKGMMPPSLTRLDYLPF